MELESSKKNIAETHIRIGIDVGGTFTHCVAIDSRTFELIAKAKVLTTHNYGVAKGIVEALHKLLEITRLSPQNVDFIAYSTTQATNAMLEGDLAKVGILAISTKDLKFITNAITKLGDIKLVSHKKLQTCHEFYEFENGIDKKLILEKVNNLIRQGAQSIAICQAYSTEDPKFENQILEIVQESNILATSSTTVSQLYGLKNRTVTAVLNAAMLPKMIESAQQTKDSIEKSGIKSKIMIMRSDGGVMDLDTMMKKPILTLLSGPASGVAAATMYLNISDGIFVEVGGTSSDISIIKNGQAQLKYAQIGQHKLFTKTIDVRTVGIGGGSMIRLKNNKILSIGPRSAHIANCEYASFYDKSSSDFNVEAVSPIKDDPKDYYIFQNSKGEKVTLTITCAANTLNIIEQNDNAKATSNKLEYFFNLFAKFVNMSPNDCAKTILDLASIAPIEVIKNLIKSYNLDTKTLSIYGGGGGASTIVSFIAKKLNYNYKLATNNDVISAIGVAIAMLRDSLEKSILNPTNQDIIEQRQIIEKSLLNMGAHPDTIEINIEIDNRNNILKVQGTGANLSAIQNNNQYNLTQDEKNQLVAKSLRTNVQNIKLVDENDMFKIYSLKENKKIFNIFIDKNEPYIIINNRGVIRFKCKNAKTHKIIVKETYNKIAELLDEYSSFGDAGKIYPGVVLISNTKLLDFTLLINKEQILSLVDIEIRNFNSNEEIIVLFKL